MKVVALLGYGREGGLGRRLSEDLLETVRALGHDLRVQDLLRDGFDPVLHLPRGEATPQRSTTRGLARRYQDDIEWMDALVVVHPVWWFSAPATLKGWVDQVLVEGLAYDLGPDDAVAPRLGGRGLLVVQTFKASRKADVSLTRGMAWGFWKHVVAPSCGFSPRRRHAIYRAHAVDPIREERIKRRLRETLDTFLADVGGISEPTMGS